MTWRSNLLIATLGILLSGVFPGAVAGPVTVVRQTPLPAMPQLPDPDDLDRGLDSLDRALDSLAGALDEQVYKALPVVVRNYHADITLHPEGYFDVREDYEVQFNQQRHGIYRNIPLEARIAEVGAGAAALSTGVRKIRIDDVEVPGHPAEVSTRYSSPRVLSVRIGDPDRYVEGIEHYTIQYRVNNAFLFEDSVTYFYWNLLGREWEFPFYNAGFTVHLPGEPDVKGFVYTGLKGDTASDATYSYQNGVFSGEATGTLGLSRDMTVLLHLPADYIDRPGAFRVWYDRYGWSLFCLGAMLLFVLAWYRWGRDNRSVKTVEYFPPDGMDPAMAGFLADERVHNRDLTALIPWWGAKGFIRIEEAGRKGVLDLKRGEWGKLVIGFIFLAAFFLICLSAGSALFRFGDQPGGDVFGILVPVLFIAFPFIFIAARTLFKGWRKKELTLYKKAELPPDASSHERIMFRGLFGAGDTVQISTLKNTFYTTLNSAKAALSKYCRGMYFTQHSKRNVVITAVLCVLAAFAGGIWLAFAFSVIGGVLFFFTCIGLSFYSGAMSRRLVAGDEALQKVEGFRMFIRKARKRELEMLVRDHPGYFEDTLAYALAFGLAEQYGRKFEGLIVRPPEWYSGNGSHFTARSFSSSFNSAMTSTAQTLVSSPSSSGSGGSGGGSSGGGFGGGGGGSW